MAPGRLYAAPLVTSLVDACARTFTVQNMNGDDMPVCDQKFPPSVVTKTPLLTVPANNIPFEERTLYIVLTGKPIFVMEDQFAPPCVDVRTPPVVAA